MTPLERAEKITWASLSGRPDLDWIKLAALLYLLDIAGPDGAPLILATAGMPVFPHDAETIKLDAALGGQGVGEICRVRGILPKWALAIAREDAADKAKRMGAK